MVTALDIIVVEDHDSLRIVTVEMLKQHGYSVIGLSCAEDLDDEAGGKNGDIFIIDLNLPNEDGISLANRVRKAKPTVGIIMMTARNKLIDKITGYESGADIYLVKPVDPAELLAAISALSRRIIKTENLGGTVFQLDFNRLILKGLNQEIKINKSEAIILNALTRAKNKQLDYWQLIEAIEEISNKTLKKSNLEVIIHRLRQKISKVNHECMVITSIREQGYKLCVELIII